MTIFKATYMLPDGSTFSRDFTDENLWCIVSGEEQVWRIFLSRAMEYSDEMGVILVGLELVAD